MKIGSSVEVFIAWIIMWYCTADEFFQQNNKQSLRSCRRWLYPTAHRTLSTGSHQQAEKNACTAIILSLKTKLKKFPIRRPLNGAKDILVHSLNRVQSVRRGPQSRSDRWQSKDFKVKVVSNWELPCWELPNVHAQCGLELVVSVIVEGMLQRSQKIAGSEGSFIEIEDSAAERTENYETEYPCE